MQELRFFLIGATARQIIEIWQEFFSKKRQTVPEDKNLEIITIEEWNARLGPLQPGETNPEGFVVNTPGNDSLCVVTISPQSGGCFYTVEIGKMSFLLDDFEREITNNIVDFAIEFYRDTQLPPENGNDRDGPGRREYDHERISEIYDKEFKEALRKGIEREAAKKIAYRKIEETLHIEGVTVNTIRHSKQLSRTKKNLRTMDEKMRTY